MSSVNAELHVDSIAYKHYLNIGVAVSGPKGRQADGGWAPGLGVTLGAGAYAFQGASGKVDTVFVPRLGAESSLSIPLRDSVSLIVRVTVAGDLRRVRLYVDEVPVADLSPWALQAGFGLRFGP